MKLEVGKYYKTRDGSLILVNDLNKLTGWFRGLLLDGRGELCNFHFLSDGTNIGEGEEFRWADLIAEWTETPIIGTLAEIGAQVGDVVECVSTGCSFVVCSVDMVEMYKFNDYRIVSRASDYQPSDDECVEAAMAKGIDYPAQQPKGPVITETVKRIVPGVYGRVHVSGQRIKYGEVGIYIGARSDEYMYTSRADLIAARDVFNQLIDAMPQG